MIRINDVVLTNEQVIELLNEETGSGKMKAQVEFQLLENFEARLKYLNERNEATYHKRYQATFGMDNRFDRRNFKTGGSETIVYYTHTITDQKTGPRYLTGNMNKIMFQNGYLIVQPGQEDLLLFMRLSEQCKTNKYWEETDGRGNQKYTPSKSFLYKELRPELDSEADYDATFASLKAQAAPLNPQTIPLATAITMATAYGMPDVRFKAEKAIRIFLSMKAKANPEQFMADLKSASFELKAKVNSAFNYGIIKYDAPYIMWANKKSGESKICNVPIGKDHVDHFVHWLREIDQSGVLDELSSLNEKAMIKEMNHPIENESDYDKLIKALGVDTLEDAKKMIEAARAGGAKPDGKPAADEATLHAGWVQKAIDGKTAQEIAKETPGLHWKKVEAVLKKSPALA